ncbi:hypothetical protein [Chitinilyticum piscinae]|uniref:Uncharacterized protein n=1 Tax=Chitinilyticum piscinae TaxID=2866724 RepID=A0A8J7K1J5_9NEIS|nr:hypothetical protein [Chitinilyticum piscinae]MBE9608767.1 hypothetical protein [Chitinilyticum piscinae]
MNHRQQKLKRLALSMQSRGSKPLAASVVVAKPVLQPAVKVEAIVASAGARVTTSKDYAEAEGISVSTARSRLEKLVAAGEASRADVVRDGVRCIEYTLLG